MIAKLHIAPLSFILGAVLLLVIAVEEGVCVNPLWLRHTPTGVSVLLMVIALFDKWLWRSRLLNGWFARRPVLCGTWRATLHPDPVSGEDLQPKLTGYMVVHQTFSALSMRLLTEESSSELIADRILRSNDGTFTVVGVYTNRPKLSLRGRRSEIHDGAFLLEVRGVPPQSLEGHYWTDRRTRGILRLSEHRPEILAGFDAARSAYENQ